MQHGVNGSKAISPDPFTPAILQSITSDITVYVYWCALLKSNENWPVDLLMLHKLSLMWLFNVQGMKWTALKKKAMETGQMTIILYTTPCAVMWTAMKPWKVTYKYPPQTPHTAYCMSNKCFERYIEVALVVLKLTIKYNYKLWSKWIQYNTPRKVHHIAPCALNTSMQRQ